MPILIRCPVLYTTTHTPRRRLALLLHLEPLFLPLPPSRASASCCELAPLLCSPAACEPSSKALRRGPYLCSRLVRTRGGGTVGGWTGAPVPWCLCLGQHGRDAAIERHLPGVRSVRYAHARRHGCHRQRPPRKGRRRDTRRPSSDVCRAASFWVFFFDRAKPKRETGGQIGERKNWAQLRVRLTCSSTAVGNEEGVGFRPFTRRHRKTSCSSRARGLSPFRGCGAATSTSPGPGPAATACAMPQVLRNAA
jgi:hypothetical protein